MRTTPETPVVVELRGVPQGATVLVDGTPSNSNTEIRLTRDRRDHRVVIVRGDQRRELTVRADANQVLVVDLPAAVQPPAAVAPAAPDAAVAQPASVNAIATDPHHRRSTHDAGLDEPPTRSRGRRRHGLDIERHF